MYQWVYLKQTLNVVQFYHKLSKNLSGIQLGTLWLNFRVFSERTLNEWLRHIEDTFWSNYERTQWVLSNSGSQGSLMGSLIGSFKMYWQCAHWSHQDQIDQYIERPLIICPVNVLSLYLAGTSWIIFQKPQSIYFVCTILVHNEKYQTIYQALRTLKGCARWEGQEQAREMYGSLCGTFSKYPCCSAHSTMWSAVKSHVWDIVVTCLGHFECTDWGLPKGIAWDIMKELRVWPLGIVALYIEGKF